MVKGKNEHQRLEGAESKRIACYCITMRRPSFNYQVASTVDGKVPWQSARQFPLVTTLLQLKGIRAFYVQHAAPDADPHATAVTALSAFEFAITG